MFPRLHEIALLALVVSSPACVAAGGTPPVNDPARSALEGPVVRVATFNAALFRGEEGRLVADLSTPDDVRARAVAEILQRVAPDVVLLNEFDHDAGGRALANFRTHYLSVGQNGAPPLALPHAFLAPPNTGMPSGFDLNADGETDGPGDALGYGRFPGQYGMVLLSRHPIDRASARTFQEFRWRDMPGALLPDDPDTPAERDWYSAEELAVFRLSSKSHWDVPIRIGDRVLHALCAHPTPPAFDGPPDFPAGVDFNGRRNHDEIRLWCDYVTPGAGDYLVDDSGRRGGLSPGASFVVLGDYNADPLDGDAVAGGGPAGAQLVECPRIRTRPVPASAGAAQAARRQGGANLGQAGDPRHDTADFGEGGVGNLRVDYALPSADLEVVDAGVFWPMAEDPLFRLVGDGGEASSDHRLVWIDVRL